MARCRCTHLSFSIESSHSAYFSGWYALLFWCHEWCPGGACLWVQFVYLLNQMILRVDTSSIGDEDFACHHRGWIKMLRRLPWWLSRRVGWRRWSKSLGICIGCIVILRSRWISSINGKDFLLSYAWLTCHSREAAFVLCGPYCF